MQSGLERYAAEKLAVLRARIKNRDRAVILGAALSTIPIFPACFIGVIFSLINLILIHKGITSRREQRLVKISLVIGCINSLIWIFIFMFLGESFVLFLEHVGQIIIAPLNIFENSPVQNLDSQDIII